MSQSLPNPVEPMAATEPAVTTEPVVAQPVGAGAAAGGAAAAAPVRSRGISNRALNVLLGGALVLAVAGIAFAVGRMTAPAPTLTGGNFPGAFNGNGQVQIGGGNGNGQGPRGNGNGGIVFGGGAGPSIEGTVESMTDTTLTIKTADGQTIQIALNDATTYHRQADASASDVVTGSKVLVRLDFRRIDGGNGPSASGAPGPVGGGMTANDVTVVP